MDNTTRAYLSGLDEEQILKLKSKYPQYADTLDQCVHLARVSQHNSWTIQDMIDYCSKNPLPITTVNALLKIVAAEYQHNTRIRDLMHNINKNLDKLDDQSRTAQSLGTSSAMPSTNY